jgi:hypothetical protein
MRYSLNVFSTTILGNVDRCRTECEISEAQTTVAVVYEGHDGWHVDVVRPLASDQRDGFNAAVETAKRSLVHYVNRLGDGAPGDATAGGLSLWLMEKDDGTAMGVDRHIRQAPTQPDDPEA